MLKRIIASTLLFLGVASSAYAHMETLTTTMDEGTSALITLGFINDSKKPTTPTNYSVYIDDENTSLRLYSFTEASPTDALEDVALPPEASRIVNEDLEWEAHIVTVVFTYSSGAKTRPRQWRLWVHNNAKMYVGVPPTTTQTQNPDWGVTPFPNSTPTPR